MVRVNPELYLGYDRGYESALQRCSVTEPTPIFKSEQQVSMSATVIFLID